MQNKHRFELSNIKCVFWITIWAQKGRSKSIESHIHLFGNLKQQLDHEMIFQSFNFKDTLVMK